MGTSIERYDNESQGEDNEVLICIEEEQYVIYWGNTSVALSTGLFK